MANKTIRSDVALVSHILHSILHNVVEAYMRRLREEHKYVRAAYDVIPAQILAVYVKKFFNGIRAQ